MHSAKGREFDVVFVPMLEKGCFPTDAEEKTYKLLASWDSGESVPTGVAAALYASWSVLHFDGSFVLTESECSGAILPRHAIRISGGRSEWAAMDALVQQVDEDVDSGQTTVRFGPPGQIEANSLVALFRALRGRRYSCKRQDRVTGESNGQTELELSGDAAQDVPCPGPGGKQKLIVQDDVTPA